jgi:hypothetical protein
VIDASLGYWRSAVVPHGSGLVLDPVRLGEPAGIAHSALLLRALSDWDVPEREGLVRALAEGILHQQRRDGSYRIFFGEEADSSLEFIPGEALLALVEATRRTGDPRFRASAERALGWYRSWWDSGHVEPEVGVFYANGQSQAAARLCLDSEREEVRRQARDYLFALHDRVLRSGFYQGLRTHPLGQPTIQVACALEGVNEAYAEALRTGDAERAGRYRACALVALAHLADAQIVEGGTERETGGFAYSSNERTQRIDVAGRVASGFMRSMENGLDTAPMRVDAARTPVG